MGKKIGILGSGTVAKTLGAGFIKYGYDVMLATRDQGKLKEWASSEGKGTIVGTFEEVGAFGEIIVLAVKGHAVEAVLEMIGGHNLAGKTVIDAANPIADAPPENGVLKFFTEMNHSLMEGLQSKFPEAHFVKAFNSVGSAQMVNPAFDVRPSMFICGNDQPSKQIVSEILNQFGWEAIDLGKATAARAIEPLSMLWCIPGFLNNQWTHALKLLK